MQFPPGVFGVLRSAKVSVGLLKRCHQCIDPRTRNLTTKLPQRNDTLCGERQACQDHHTHDDTKVRRHMMQRNDLHGKACDQRRQHQAREHKRAFALVGSTQVDDDSGALAVRIGGAGLVRGHAQNRAPTATKCNPKNVGPHDRPDKPAAAGYER